MNLQRFAIVAFTLTYFAWHIHIRQKIHLDFDNTFAFTSFTTTTFDIKRESTWQVATNA